jgi:hypothetical protein
VTRAAWLLTAALFGASVLGVDACVIDPNPPNPHGDAGDDDPPDPHDAGDAGEAGP